MKTEMKAGFRRQTGVTLVELLIGIVVIGLVIAGIMIAAQKVFVGNETNRAATSVATLASNVKGYYDTPSYAGLTNTVVIDANLAPQNMVSGANLVNEWGGTVTVVPATLGAVANNAISITYTDIPTEACAKLSTQTATNFDQVSIDDGTTVTVVVTPANRVINRAAVAAACGGAAIVSMTWQKK